MEQNIYSNTYMMVENSPGRVVAVYSKGKIQKVDVKKIDDRHMTVSIIADDEYRWETDKIYLVGYMMYGIPVSKDGRYIFAQQDMRGLVCLDATNGDFVWKTESRAEYSHVLVGDDFLCCSKGKNEIQLINIENGSVIQTYRTPFDNRFEVLTDDIILNHTRSKSWEVLSSKTFDVLQTIPDAFLWQNKRSIEQFYKSKT